MRRLPFPVGGAAATNSIDRDPYHPARALWSLVMAVTLADWLPNGPFPDLRQEEWSMCHDSIH